MGFRDGVKRGGGGFWNNTDAEWVGYKYETFLSKKDEKFVSIVIEMLVDGAEASTSKSLMLGYAARYSISKDVLTLSAADGGIVALDIGTPGGLFLDSLAEKGEHLNIGSLLPDITAGEPLNFEALIGTRLRLVQQVNEKRTKKQGQVIGKDGNKYDQKDLVVDIVYSVPGAANGAKASARAATTGRPAVVKTTSIQDLADLVVKETIKASGGKKVLASKLSVSVIRVLSKEDKATKDAVRAMVNDDAYLTDGTERGAFEFDGEYVAA